MKLQSQHKKTSSSILSFPLLFQRQSHDPSYYDLNRFREELHENGQNLKPQFYQQHKNAACMYRCIFFGISALFFLLLTIMYFQKTSWFCLVYFSQHFMAKMFVCTICGSLGISSFFFGFSIKAEKEAVFHLCRLYRSKIRRIYMRKRTLLGWKQIVAFLHHEPDAISKEYDQAMEKVHENSEASIILMHQIRRSKNLDTTTKEHLYNQALAELQDKLQKTTHAFQG